MPRIIQGGVTTEGLRKEFSFRDRRDGSTVVRVKRGGKGEEVKLEEIFLARCQK